MKKEEFWFYLEAYVIIIKKRHEILLLNLLTGGFIIFKNTNNLNHIISELQKNNYCIKINKEELKNKEIHNFFKKVKKFYYGDLIATSLIYTKPFIPFTIMNYQNDLTREDNKYITGNNLLLRLEEITVFINSSCSRNCNLCNISYKQTNYCTKDFPEAFNMDALFDFLEPIIKYNIISHINVLGGNILKCNRISHINKYLTDNGINPDYYIHFSNINSSDDGIIRLIEKFGNLTILLSYPMNLGEFKVVNALLQNLKIKFSYKAIIINEKQYEYFESLFNNQKIHDYEITPVYNGRNISFFKKYLFIRKTSLISTKIFKNKFFLNQTFNINNYGKLIITSNGDVYSNLNFPKLGNTQTHSLHEILYEEVSNGKSWHLIRNAPPCCDCVFQFICPQISNYELVIGRPNLCHIQPEESLELHK